MLNRNAQYYQWLLPYLEGGLDDARRAQMEARLRDDPALAAEAARLRRTVDGLRTAARQPRPESAQVPRDLWPRLRAQMGERVEPAPTPARSAHGWWLTGVGATAAATLALAMVWLPGWHAPEQVISSPPVVSPLPGPGRIAGPPSVTLTPAGSPHASPALSAAGSKPATVKSPGKAIAPMNAVAPPISLTNGTGTDPFALRPAPAAPRRSGLMPMSVPGGPLAVKPAMPTAVRSLGLTASHQAGHTGADAAGPGSPTKVLTAPAVLPFSPVQDQPASPLRVTPVPSAPTINQVQNGAMTNSAAAGQNAMPTAPSTPNAAGQAQTVPQAKSQAKVFAMIPLTTPRAANEPEHGARRGKITSKRGASASMMENALRAQAMAGGGGFGGNAQGGLDTWQAALSAAVQPPLWGDTSGEQQAGEALMSAKESGALDELRARLEAQRTQSPKDLVTGRMLAAVYEFGFSREAALHERQRVANLEGAVGEDWYALAQAEDHAGSPEAARAAYRRALESMVPPSPLHAAVARARS